MKKVGYYIFTITCLASFMACKQKPTNEAQPVVYTKIDSLTETYLTLQDSILSTWNILVKDENQKISNMHALLHLMMKSDAYEQSSIILLEQRLDQLGRIRFTQKTMANAHVVDEYDFASNSLISEVISFAENDPNLFSKTEIQNLVDEIKGADQRVNTYRNDYDSIIEVFNIFLEKEQIYLAEIDRQCTKEKRPTFQMASDN